MDYVSLTINLISLLIVAVIWFLPFDEPKMFKNISYYYLYYIMFSFLLYSVISSIFCSI